MKNMPLKKKNVFQKKYNFFIIGNDFEKFRIGLSKTTAHKNAYMYAFLKQEIKIML